MTAQTFKRAAEAVDHQRGQGLAVDVLGDQYERLARVDHFLQDGYQFLDVREFLFVDEDINVLEHAFHLGRIGDEVGREVAAVELHALDPLDLGGQALALVDGDDAVLADLFHGVGQELADFGVVVGGDAADLGDLFLLILDRDRHAFELVGDIDDGPLDALLELERVDARDDGAEALVEDGLGQNGGGGRAVAGDVARLAGDLADHLGAHVFVDVFEVDFLGHGHAVLGDGGRAEALLDDDVAAARAERHFDRLGQLGNAAFQGVAGFLIKCNHLGHGWGTPRKIVCFVCEGLGIGD